jgi:hypothetical protein
MTVREILTAMLRRWYIPVTVLACAALATVLLARDGGIYSTRTVVSFTLSPATSLTPDNGSENTSVVAFAGAVVSAIHNGRPPAPYSMAEAPYYGAGVREGVRVDLVDSGNQWVSSFSRSDIEIRIVGRSLDWVTAQQDQMVDLVLGFADAEQAALLIPEEDRITATVAPITTEIEHIHSSQDLQIVAAVAMLAAALLVSAWLSITLDQRLRRPAGPTRIRPHPSPRRILEGSPS